MVKEKSEHLLKLQKGRNITQDELLALGDKHKDKAIAHLSGLETIINNKETSTEDRKMAFSQQKRKCIYIPS